jgi:hypothetical protein
MGGICGHNGNQDRGGPEQWPPHSAPACDECEPWAHTLMRTWGMGHRYKQCTNTCHRLRLTVGQLEKVAGMASQVAGTLLPTCVVPNI